METKPKPESKITDKILEAIGIVGIIVLILLPAAFYNVLPEEIPTHFGFNGKPDDFSSNEAIWMLPIIGVVLYSGLVFINYFLVRKEIAVKINLRVELKQTQSVFTLLQFIKAVLAISFAYIEFGTIQTALNRANGLGFWFLPVFLVLLTFGPVVFLISRSGK